MRVPQNLGVQTFVPAAGESITLAVRERCKPATSARHEGRFWDRTPPTRQGRRSRSVTSLAPSDADRGKGDPSARLAARACSSSARAHGSTRASTRWRGPRGAPECSSSRETRVGMPLRRHRTHVRICSDQRYDRDGSSLQLVPAPGTCDCRPRSTLLSAATVRRARGREEVARRAPVLGWRVGPIHCAR